MGTASFVTPGRPQRDSLRWSLPIENSPPGIQTIPLGCWLWGLLLLTRVASKPAGNELAGLETAETFGFDARSLGLRFGPRKAKAAAPPPIQVPIRIQIIHAKGDEAGGLEGCLGAD